MIDFIGTLPAIIGLFAIGLALDFAVIDKVTVCTVTTRHFAIALVAYSCIGVATAMAAVWTMKQLGWWSLLGG